MIKRTVLAAAAAALIAVPAYAAHCPKDAAAIDHALANMEVSEEVKTQVQGLRDRGMELHNAGNHRESEATLAEGMRILLMEIKQ